MALLDIIDAVDIELLGLFVLGTYAIALITAGGAGERALGYADLKKPAWAPPSWLFAVVWTVLYTLTGVAAYLVRVAGGAWVEDVNRRPLILYTVLQVVLAMYFMFAIGRLHLWAALVVFASLVLSIVVGVLFVPLSVTAAVLMFIESLWLVFALGLQMTIAVRNSGNTVRSMARSQSTAEASQRAVKRHMQRKTGFSDS